MRIDRFSPHLFWSYKKDADLPDKIIIEQGTTYGDIEDLVALSKLYTKDEVNVALESFHRRNKKRINLLMKVIYQA